MASSSPHRSPPPPPPPPRSALPSGSKSEHQSPSAAREPLHQNGGSPLHNNNTPSSASSPPRIALSSSLQTTTTTATTASKITTNKVSTASPLKAAATLIQTLEIAQTEMTSFAADAARDAESARRNARAAQEIARRYQNRSYPKVKSSFEDITVSALSSKSSKKKTSMSMSIGNSSNNTNHNNSRPTGASSTNNSVPTMTPRPEPPKLKTLYSHQQQQSYQQEDDQQGVTNGLLAIGAELKTPPGVGADAAKAAATPENGGDKVSGRNQEIPFSQSHSTHVNRKSRGFHTPSSVERIAQHHAEDVLKLTLELERTKQALKSEQRLHQDCKTVVGSLQSKTKSLEEQNQRLLEELEQERQQSTQKLSSLEQELESSRMRVQAAEEDAQLALDLAKDSSEQTDYLEDELLKAVEEVRQLNEANKLNLSMNGTKPSLAVETPRRHVRFADNETKEDGRPGQGEDTPESMFGTPMSFSSTATSGPSRSMVAAERQVLRRQMASSPGEVVLQLEMTPAKSAERRQRLRQRMTQLDAVIAASSSSSAASTPTRTTPTSSPIRLLTAEATTPAGDNDSDALHVRKKLEECQAACKILQTSGKRLDLDGYWWRGNGGIDIGKSKQLSHPVQLDAMTRQYCQNVEFKIDRQKKEINELESLCGYLEQKLVMDGN